MIVQKPQCKVVDADFLVVRSNSILTSPHSARAGQRVSIVAFERVPLNVENVVPRQMGQSFTGCNHAWMNLNCLDREARPLCLYLPGCPFLQDYSTDRQAGRSPQRTPAGSQSVQLPADSGREMVIRSSRHRCQRPR